jgi:hypothetical protein
MLNITLLKTGFSNCPGDQFAATFLLAAEKGQSSEGGAPCAQHAVLLRLLCVVEPTRGPAGGFRKPARHQNHGKRFSTRMRWQLKLGRARPNARLSAAIGEGFALH